MNFDVWMHPSERGLVESLLRPDHVMLEWGSGGSTVAFSKQVKSYYSIEHNWDWYCKVKQAVEGTNVDLRYIPVNGPLPNNYFQAEYQHYRDYLDIVYQLGQMFDVVLIDGRARRLCALKAIPFLKPNAHVIVHDYSLRAPYHCITDYYDKVAEISTTPQTIAIFQLKPKWWEIQGYDINLGSFEREFG